MTVYTCSGQKLELKEPALGKGGEGSVYEIIGYNKVAKIYDNHELRKAREDKIAAMVEIAETSSDFSTLKISDCVAWPRASLYDASGNFIGFGMEKVAFKELDDIYAYPAKINIALGDRIDCLISLCDTIDRLHKINQVFGDFNPNNLKVKNTGGKWSIIFVDADSYHISYKRNLYKCTVCLPGYVAPELIRKCRGGIRFEDFPGQTFTKETDYFSLALHIFRMIFNGAHPFNCRYTGKNSAPAIKGAIDGKVEKCMTPYFRNVPNYDSPIYAPDVSCLPPYMKALFVRAFIDGDTNPSARPTAKEWEKALKTFRTELTKCNNSHQHWKGLSSCPYCKADQKYTHKRKPVSPTRSVVNKPYNHQPPVPRGTTTYRNPPAAATTLPCQKVRMKGTKSPAAFWTITLFIACLLLSILGSSVLPLIYDSIVGEPIITSIGRTGGVIAGIIGLILYNSRWCPNRGGGPFYLRHYIFSILTSLGFVVGWGIIMAIIAACFYILGIILVIAIIVAIISGG